MESHAQHAAMDAPGASQDQAIQLTSDNRSDSDVEPVQTVQTPSQPFSSHDTPNGVSSGVSLLKLGEALQPESVRKRGIAVVVHPVENPSEYRLYQELAVSEIVERYDDGGRIEYLVRFEDESEEVVSQTIYFVSMMYLTYLLSAKPEGMYLLTLPPNLFVFVYTILEKLAPLSSPLIHFLRSDDYSLPHTAFCIY